MGKTKTTQKRYQFPRFQAYSFPSLPLNGSCDKTVVKSYTDHVTFGDNYPDWRERLAGGLPATTSMSGIRHRRTQSYGTATRFQPSTGNSSRTTGVLLGGELLFDSPFGTSTLETEASNEAIRKFTADFRRKTRSFQGGVFLGELLTTARGLARPASSLRQEFGRLSDDMLSLLRKQNGQRGSKEALRDLLKTAADTYLEWQFGVKPLVHDIDDACTAFRKMASGRTYDIIRVKGSASASAQVTADYPALSVASACVAPAEGYFNRIAVDQSEVSYLFGWKNTNPSGEMPVPMTIGTTLADFVPTLWEICPWSWAVDYFTNVGDVLDAWSIRMIKFAWGQRTVRNSRTHKNFGLVCPPISPNGSNYFLNSGSGGDASMRTTTILRERLDEAPVPDFQFEIPGMGSQKWVNLAAVFTARTEARRLASLRM